MEICFGKYQTGETIVASKKEIRTDKGDGGEGSRQTNMTYIDKLIREIAQDMAIAENKRTRFLLGLIIGFFIGLVFWLAIVIEWYILLPIN